MSMYNIIQKSGLVIAALFTVFWAKNFSVGKLKALAITVATQFMVIMSSVILTWIENDFQNFGAKNAVRGLPLLLLFGLLEAWVFRMDLLKTCDFQAMMIPMAYGLARFGCLAASCCRGFYYLPGTTEYEIAHALTGSYQLPIVVLEAVSSVMISVIIIIYSIKTRFKVTGYAFALYHVLYGSVRFLGEFLRDNEKIITFGPMYGAFTSEGKVAVWGISSLAIWSLAIFAVGVVMFICLRIYHKKHAEIN